MLKTFWERARTLLFGDRRRGIVTVTAAILAAGAVGLPALASGPAFTTTAQIPAAASVNPLPSESLSPSPAVSRVTSVDTPPFRVERTRNSCGAGQEKPIRRQGGSACTVAAGGDNQTTARIT